MLAARVSQARAERERATETAISLRDLAAASGLSLTALQTVLAGRVAPRLSTLQGLAAALRVRVGWLLGE